MNEHEQPISRSDADRISVQQEYLLKQTLQEILESCAPHQRALLGALALADRHRIDLVSLLLSLADELPSRYQFPIRGMVQKIEEGATAIDALESIPELLPPTSVLALRLAGADGSLSKIYSGVLQRNLDSSEDEAGQLESKFSKISRLVVRICFFWAVITFFMLKIVPEFSKMFDEFGIELPSSMLLLISFSNSIVRYWFFVPLLLLLVMAICFPWCWRSLQHLNPMTWRRPYIPPDVARRRSLALVTQAEIPIAGGVQLIANCLAGKQFLRRWSRASTRIETSQNQWDAFAQEHILTRREAEALKLTPAQETQSWLLRWTANDWQQRRLAQSAFWMRVVMAVVQIVLGAVVVLMCVGVFSVLIKIMMSLS